MKTGYIVTISVVISIVAVFGILFGLQYQAEEYRQVLGQEIKNCFIRYNVVSQSQSVSDCLDSIINRYDIDVSPEYFISQYAIPEEEVTFELPKTYEGIEKRLAELEKDIEVSKRLIESGNP